MKNNNHRRFRLQVIALILGLMAPFGLYLGLVNGSLTLAIVFFGLLVSGMALTVAAG